MEAGLETGYTPAGPVVESFHASSAFVRGLMGPVGSSKSTACCIEILSRAQEQKPFNGVRRTRWAVIRNTYPELKSTTIKTWTEWAAGGVMKWDAPISCHMGGKLPDGTTLEMEVFFVSADRPEEINKLKGMEITGAWLNEAGELAKAVFDMALQRVGRFPPLRQGGPTWTGVIMDTNPPDDDHWWYRLAERERPKDWDFYKQPGGLVEDKGEYKPNPLAENISNLPGGHAYYLRQVPGKTKEWIKVFLLGNYGTISDGRPVYPEYNDELHCRKAGFYPDLPLLLGFDYGLTPACVICQVSPRGQLVVLSELFAKDMGIRQFSRDVVKPHLALKYPNSAFQAVGDPAGTARSDTDEKTCFMELAEEGIPAMPASTNSLVGRREAVAKYLTRLVDGKPAFILDPGCDMLRRGFNGRYQYKRLQVVGSEKYKDIPDKNDYSHLQDALQYAALHSQNMGTQMWGAPINYPKKSGIV
jgi:hypothetical protein